MMISAVGLAGLSLIGLPPSGGSTAKWLYLRASVAAGRWLWAAVILAGGSLAAGYVYGILTPALYGAPTALEMRPRVGKQAIAFGAGALRHRARLRPAILLRFLQTGRPAVAAQPRSHDPNRRASWRIPSAATIAAPPNLLALSPFRGLRPWMLRGQWIAPIPGLAAALFAPNAGPLAIDTPVLHIWLALDVAGALMLARRQHSVDRRQCRRLGFWRSGSR
jgi:hypothetical protein